MKIVSSIKTAAFWQWDPLTTDENTEEIVLCKRVLVATQLVLSFKIHSHLTSASAFAFSFDLCRPVLENANMMCEHHHLLPETKLVTFHANAEVVWEKMGSEPFT